MAIQKLFTKYHYQQEVRRQSFMQPINYLHNFISIVQLHERQCNALPPNRFIRFNLIYLFFAAMSIASTVLRVCERKLLDEYAALDALTALLLDSQVQSVQSINYDALFRRASPAPRPPSRAAASTNGEQSTTTTAPNTPNTTELVNTLVRELEQLPLHRIERILLQLWFVLTIWY